MSERRRLKAGVEVEVDGDSVWLHGPGAVMAFTVPRKYAGLDLITEPIPEEPAGPKVGDEVTCKWLASEYANGRYHVVRNPDGSAASWDKEVDGTSAVEDADGTYAKSGSGDTWPLLALHPVERWEESEKERRTNSGDLAEQVEAQRVILVDAVENIDRMWARIEALEELLFPQDADDPNSKEVMPVWGRGNLSSPAPGVAIPPVSQFGDTPIGSTDVAPPPRADEDAPGGDEPSVEEVLGELDSDGINWYGPVGRAAARIIREQKGEIERLTERLTITDEKVEAAYKAWIRGPSSMQAWNTALRAAGMIDPEVVE